MAWVVWTVSNWYLCSWHSFWRITWPVFVQTSVIPDPHIIYFTDCDVKCHLITWRFIILSSVATFGVTLKNSHVISLVCFICCAVCNLFMLMNWCVRQLFLCILNMHCCLLQTVWKLLSSVCKTLFTHKSCCDFAITDTMVINKTFVQTKRWWFAWWILLGILRKLLYCHAGFPLVKNSHTNCLFWTRCHFALLMNAALLVARVHCKIGV
jgi:hypothetical protein